MNSIAVNAPKQPLSEIFTTSLLLSSKAPDPRIDPRFGYKAIYGEISLPITPCFMNAVELMAQYAELDYMSKARKRHGVVLPAYPQVEMAVLPVAPATSVEIRLIIWGIWEGIRDMLNSKNGFKEAEFQIKWSGKVVAFIYFTKPLDLQRSSGNGTQDQVEKDLDLSLGLNETTINVPDTLNNITSDALTDAQFTWMPLFIQGGKTLTPVEVFVTVLAGLKSAAQPAATDKVPGPFASSADGFDANMQFYLHKRRVPRTSPPFFQYIHIIKSLRLIPGYMLEKKKFADLGFGVVVSGKVIAEGILEKGPYIPYSLVSGDLLGPDYNVSIS